MKLGEFREKTKHLPDDADILGEFEYALHYNETDISYVLPPVLEHSWAICLVGGQIVNIELDLDARIDAELGA